ncbi:LisH motif-containing protein [Klebsormidium nitens]|uniref:LisH motif-containing protein n=1 Tax=Klebsormidium nitens TaxID=105231 RepID=A0A1Y1I5V5_KLENI|nr:LisH motif-containing protein [Klebsormidium nitens]|eukprot:GAQ85873.1 LisH motif-containing protein [Klebsormidium nitens]
MIDHIRSLVNEGAIESAIALTNKSNANILEDQQLLFQLYKEQFLEHLRAGSDEAAIHCARKFLEPLALNAYLEAYQDFKQVMLAFLFGPEDTGSPVAAQWSLKQRFNLAGTLASNLRAAAAAYDPLLSLLLRYLISIQKRFLEIAGNLQPSVRLGRVLREVPFDEKDPPLVPKSSLDRAPDFKEKDVQDLAHAVELPRQAAVDSLRVANGHVITALKNELSRMRVNRTFVDELAREYGVYRGLVDCGPESSRQSCTEAGSSPSQVPQYSNQNQPSTSNTEYAVGNNSRGSVEVGTRSASKHVSSREAVQGVEKPQTLRKHGSEAEVSGPCTVQQQFGNDKETKSGEQVTQVDEDGDVRMHDAQEGDQSNGASGEPVAPGPKPVLVWRGRPEGFRELHDGALGLHLEDASAASTEFSEDDVKSLEASLLNPDGPTVEAHAGEPGSLVTEQSSEKASASKASGSEGGQQRPRRQASAQEYLQTSVLGTDVLRRYREVLEIRDMVSTGATGRAVEETLRLVPGFFADKQELLFRLKEVEFVRLLEAGELKPALRLARESLGPLAAEHRELLPALKATLLALAKPGPYLPKVTPTTAALATSLQEALAGALGVPEPLLVVLMRSLLDAHDEWFEMQMCEDPFRSFFKLDALKSSESDGDSALESTTEAAEVPQSSGEQSAADESILTLMEFLAISRSDAIVLLDKFDGSVEAVFADKLGGD